MRRIPLIFLFALLLSLGTLAQQPDNAKPQPTPAPTEPQQPSRSGEDDVVKITTNLVQVDAVVTDKNGKLITDLRQDEVQIFEDGHQQKEHRKRSEVGAGLVLGEYVLQITVTDPLADEKHRVATQWIDFEIVK